MRRRAFLKSSAAAGVAVALEAVGHKKSYAANDKIAICMMGVRGRGGSVLSTFAGLPEVEVRYVCDIDEKVREAGIARVEQTTGRRPIGIKDYRQALEDKSLNALGIGTPDDRSSRRDWRG